ncbi:TadE/TadG family type IV pilus assembly protein [Spongisporangium articulatum]|uniref:TadE/TadG family type IV pilus assembly protein n=1 Tax=Spongisporangium articulatum TaxID=3362603 RepID=A0ABW8AST8_9ACTN
MRSDPRRGDRGATAVEFALIFPLLAGFLFAIVQYGYGLYQYQAFVSAMDDAARATATGISNCAKLSDLTLNIVEGNGLPVDADHPLKVTVNWLNDTSATKTTTAQRLGYAEVVGTYDNPMNFNVPLVPFPSSFTSTQRVMVQQTTSSVTSAVPTLLNCPAVTGVTSP